MTLSARIANMWVQLKGALDSEVLTYHKSCLGKHQYRQVAVDHTYMLHMEMAKAADGTQLPALGC